MSSPALEPAPDDAAAILATLARVEARLDAITDVLLELAESFGGRRLPITVRAKIAAVRATRG